MPEVRGVSAMVLEDEPRYRAFLTDVLRDMACTPITAASGEEGMRLVEASPPDMLFLDLNLPYLDGMSFLERFRGVCPDAPVVIITGYGDLESARRAIRLGVTDFLTKPCDLGELEQAIDRARRHVVRREPVIAPEPDRPAADVRSLETIEREAIIDALRHTSGNRSAAARILGISRRAVYNKLEEYRRQGHDVP